MSPLWESYLAADMLDAREPFFSSARHSEDYVAMIAERLRLDIVPIPEATVL